MSNLDQELGNPLSLAGQAIGFSNEVQRNQLLQTENQRQQTSLQSEKFELARKRLQNYQDVLTSAMASRDPTTGQPNISKDKLKDAMLDNYAKYPDLHDPVNFAKDLASISDLPDNPQGIIQKLLPQAAMSEAGLKRIEAIQGSIQAHETGAGTVFYRNPLTGPATNVSGNPIAGIPQLRQGIDQSGAPFSELSGAAYNDNNSLVPSANNNAPVNRLTGNSGGMVADNILAARGGIPSNPDGSGPTAPGPAELPNGRMMTGLAPGEAETKKASAEQGQSLQQSADNVPQRKALLGEMEGALGDFNSGPGAERWNRILASAKRLGLPISADRISSQEEFNKLATQLAQAQFSSLGGTGTDAKLDSAIHTSPSTALSNMGNKRIIALLKGNEDAIALKNREWQQYKAQNGVGSYGAFSTQFNNKFDPRVFQFPYMDASERRQVMKGMSAAEKEKFSSIFEDAVNNGWIPNKNR